MVVYDRYIKLSNLYLNIVFPEQANNIKSEISIIPFHENIDYTIKTFNKKLFENLISHLVSFDKSNEKYYEIHNIDNDKIYIVFRGTNGRNEFLTDIQIIQKPYLYNENARIHSGFYDLYNKIRNQLLNELKLSTNNFEKYIYITGHSLGASLATILSFELIELNLTNKITIYTIGMPYSINPYISDVLKEIEFYRIENEFDELTNFFTSCIIYKNYTDFYSKPGILISFQENISFLKNHSIETYYKNIDNYKIAQYII
jgi:predicted lipase